MTDSKRELLEFLNARLDQEAAIWRKGSALLTQRHFADLSLGMLRDIEAKRKVVRRCGRIWSEYKEGGSLSDLARAVDAALILHDLADPYSDHPGYHTDWGDRRGVERVVQS